MAVANQIDAHHAWVTPYSFESENGMLGVRLSVSDVSSSAQLVGSGNVVVLTNPGDIECYIALGGASVAATTAHFPILAGTQVTISTPVDGTGTWIAAITDSGTTTLLAHVGCGI